MASQDDADTSSHTTGRNGHADLFVHWQTFGTTAFA